MVFALLIPVMFAVVLLSVDFGKAQTVYSDNDSAVQSSAYGTAEFYTKATKSGTVLDQAALEEYAMKMIT